MLQRFLDPSVLAGISGLELVAKTVVDGYIAGMHRSPDFGFSQEFAEYRAYTPGDDLRHVDWNVFARTERAYLKRYRGETNTQVTVMLDASASMGYGSHKVNKLEYSKFLCASICYFAHLQRDAAGMIVFDDEVRQYVTPSTRQGQMSRLFHAIENADPRARTDFAKPFLHFQQFLHRRGLAAVISDFYADPNVVVEALAPLRHRGNDVVMFHLLDPHEIRPVLREPVLMVDMETNETMEVSPEFVREEYGPRIDQHIETLKTKARGAGMDYFLINTERPLDEALREYLGVRQGRM
jgi:uncharacterized protein (DUF58 family)